VHERDVTSSSPAESGEAGKGRGLGGSVRNSIRRSGGFLLEPVLGNGQPKEATSIDRHGKRRAQNGTTHVDKRRPAPSRLSADSSVRSSPLSREVSVVDGPNDEHQSPEQPRARPQTMDPAQLVQMALSLSESRRRHASGPLQVPLGSPRDSRRVSGVPSPGSRAESVGKQWASYASDGNMHDSPQSLSAPREGVDQRVPSLHSQHDQQLQLPTSFTPATLSRAEKARKYFELASEHRRLLQHLPPLKSDADAAGNYTYHSTGSPGSAHTELKRIPSHAGHKHPLGRAYNPLQALRNRRLRQRERRPLTAPPEAWTDVDRIRAWIDDVEAATRDPSFRPVLDRVQLPPYSGETEAPVEVRENTKGHRRTDTVSSVITRLENGWSIEPAELLADLYWTEKPENKASIENRFGNPIFPSLARQSTDKGRHSLEVPGSSVEHEKTPMDADLSSPKRTSRAAQLLPMRRGKLNRSPSTSSASSYERRAPPPLRYGIDEGGDENVGPLERHMQEMIEKDERGELNSPELLSPDHWDSRHTQFPVLRGHRDHGRRDVHSQEHGGLTVDPSMQHRRAKSADGRVGGSVSSIDDLSIAEPASPVKTGHMPSLGMDLTPPTKDDRPNTSHKSKLRHIPFLRSHSKDRNGTGRTDFAMSNDNRSYEPRSSQESARPNFIARHRTTESIASSLRRQGTHTISNASGKESTSTVGRFLKGSRIEKLVRNESSRLGGPRNKEHADDVGVSDIDPLSDRSDDEVPSKEGMPRIVADDEDEYGPRASFERERGRPKPKYHLQNLPSFRSPARSNTGTPDHHLDHISRQQQAQREAQRSPRFDKLAPPRINPPTDDFNPDWAFGGQQSGPFEHRKSYGFLGVDPKGASGNSSMFSLGPPGEMRRLGHYPVTALSKLQGEGQRHWSISDQAQPQQASKITMRDVARVRALLLSSGIKAREIQRKANTPRDPPLPVIQQAADFLGQDFSQVTKREEHLVASRLLAENLDKSLSDFEASVTQFEKGPAQQLARELDALQQKATDQLTKLVHETSDDADAFVVELTTKQPQDLKMVDEAIEALLRQRRRQWRILRRTGFFLLEWGIMGALWSMWAVVAIFNLFRRLVWGLWRFLRWLFWF
jgi:hypothetical protein